MKLVPLATVQHLECQLLVNCLSDMVFVGASHGLGISLTRNILSTLESASVPENLFPVPSKQRTKVFGREGGLAVAIGNEDKKKARSKINRLFGSRPGFCLSMTGCLPQCSDR